MTLWRIWVTTTAGIPEAIELRAPSESQAQDQVRVIRPGAVIQRIERRPTRVP
jgi:hypothetical protein